MQVKELKASVHCSGIVQQQQCSCCACSGKVACSMFKPILLQLAAQMGCCFVGESQHTLPWLQLLARYHALAADEDEFAGKCNTFRKLRSGSGDPAQQQLRSSDSLKSRSTAVAVALSSLGSR